MLNLNGDSIPYFRELNKTQLTKIESISKLYTCKNGDVIFLQGELCQSWIIVNEGSLLCRKRVDETVVEEEIILSGDSYDFESTIKNNVTSKSLEAIEDCSILVVDILGLKKIAQKNPIIISLIKIQLSDKYESIWEDNILKKEKKVPGYNYIIKKCWLWTFIRVFPITLITIGSLFFLPFLKVYFILVCALAHLLYFLNSRLSYLEINKEIAFKREFHLIKISSASQSIPLEKIEGSGIIYTNKLYKLFKLGELTIRSTTVNLTLSGVHNPERVIKEIDNFKFNKINIDKAIEVSTFKNLYCKKNNLFYIESSLEYDQFSIFTFRKSFIYFLVRTLPAFFIFLITSIGLYYLFDIVQIFLLNIPTVLLSIWHFWDWINDKYAFEGDKVIDIEKRPFWGKEQRIVADIFSVQSIYKEQKHLFQILFNYGDIKILTLGGEILYPSINNPNKVINNLYLVKKYYHSRKENLEKQERQEEFLNYTKYYQELSRK